MKKHAPRIKSMKCAFAGAAVLATLSISTAAHAAIVSDGDFSAWSSFYFVTDDPYVVSPGPNTSNGTTTRVSTGGNPGAYLQAVDTFTTGDTIWTGGIKNDYSYNPAVDGAIATLSVTADVRQITNNGSSAWQLVVEQSGQRYYSYPWAGFSGSTWLHVTASDLSATSFSTNPWSGYLGILPSANHPDFGTTGAPIQFGFMFGNRVLGNGTLTNTLGLDNFSVVTTSPVPLPTAVWLFGSGLLGLIGIGRRKAA